MSDPDTHRTEAPTRRDYVKYGGAVIGGGLLAGCTGDSGPGATDTRTATATAEPTETEGTTPTETDGSYDVCMEPVGCHTFEKPPERWVAAGPTEVDFGVSLGQAEGLVGIAYAYYYDATRFLFEELGIEGLPSEVPEVYGWEGGFDKEAFYEINADIHLIDPNAITINDDAWDENDIEEIESNVGPLFGKSNGRDRGWNSKYLVPMYELLERYAQVFDERDRYDQLVAVHDEVQSDVASRLPPESERPSVGVLLGGSDPAEGTFYLSRITDAGSRHKHYRDLAIDDAFGDLNFDGETFIEADYETLLDVDPDVLLFDNHLPGVSRSLALEGTETWRNDHVVEMENDPVGSELTAVIENRVYPTGMGEQGPITNLFNTEVLGKQLYPEQFPEDEQLFDRQEVADIVNGDI